MASQYQLACSLDEALSLLAEGEWQVLAGGTDIYPAKGDGPFHRNLLDVSGLADLRTLEENNDHWRLGGGLTWSDVIRADLPSCFDGLKLAAREVGSVQIQNAGTIAGNLCNASPAADGVPPLLTLDAQVELTSRQGQRALPLSEFVLGVRQTALRPGELVSAILVPKKSLQTQSHFIKLGARKYLVISIVMVAVVLELDDRSLVKQLGVAVGSCSAVAARLHGLERDAIGRSVEALCAPGFITADHLAPLAPISDVRATSQYRLEAAREVVLRTIMACREPSKVAA